MAIGEETATEEAAVAGDLKIELHPDAVTTMTITKTLLLVGDPLVGAAKRLVTRNGAATSERVILRTTTGTSAQGATKVAAEVAAMAEVAGAAEPRWMTRNRAAVVAATEVAETEGTATVVPARVVGVGEAAAGPLGLAASTPATT